MFLTVHANAGPVVAAMSLAVIRIRHLICELKLWLETGDVQMVASHRSELSASGVKRQANRACLMLAKLCMPDLPHGRLPPKG